MTIANYNSAKSSFLHKPGNIFFLQSDTTWTRKTHSTTHTVWKFSISGLRWWWPEDGRTFMTNIQLTLPLYYEPSLHYCSTCALQSLCVLWMRMALRTVTDKSTLSLLLLLLVGLVELRVQESRVKPLDMWLCGLSVDSHDTSVIQRTLGSELMCVTLLLILIHVLLWL